MKNQKKIELCSPLTGYVVPLREVADEVFSQRILGDGIAVRPSEGVLCSPVDGRVDQLFDSNHAITLVSEQGVELLLHIGIDTVALKGEYFNVKVASGEQVKRGTALIAFNIEGIEGAGYDVTTPMIVSNSADFELEAVASGDVRTGQPLLTLTRRTNERSEAK